MVNSGKSKNSTWSFLVVLVLLGVLAATYFNYSRLQAYFARKDIQEEVSSEIIANKNAPANSFHESTEDALKQEVETEKCYPDSADCEFSIVFLETDNFGRAKAAGENKVVIFDPRSPRLDFKVNLGLNHLLYETDANGNLLQDYTAKSFRELVTEENAFLDNQKPLAAINADYIDTQNNPQGLNISKGEDYSGEFRDRRSSFSISKKRVPSIGIVEIADPDGLNYISVGGNGRFYNNGQFKDICSDLGEYACLESTERSMAAITNQGYVILLTNREGDLLPAQFEDVLTGISKGYGLGDIQEAVLFDGGKSPSMYFDGEFVNEGPGPIGSVLLIYKKKSS